MAPVPRSSAEGIGCSQSRILQGTALVACTFAEHSCTALTRFECATTLIEFHARGGMTERSRAPEEQDWRMMKAMVRRVDFGHFVRPAEETGTGAPRIEALLGYVVEHADGVLLFDTGMGSRADVDAHYRPTCAGLHEALRTVGYRLDDITEVANCHLHFDHCGGNPLLAGRPFFAQRGELEVARRVEDYTSLNSSTPSDVVGWS